MQVRLQEAVGVWREHVMSPALQWRHPDVHVILHFLFQVLVKTHSEYAATLSVLVHCSSIKLKSWRFNGHIKTAKQRTRLQQYGDCYTGRWWVSCCIWYSKVGPGRAAARPAHDPPRCTKSNSKPISGQCTSFILFDVPCTYLCPWFIRCVMHLPVPMVNWLISYSTLQTVFEKQWPRSAKYELNCLGLMTCSCFQITVISVDILHIDGRSSRPHYYYLYTRGVNSGQQLARNATDKTPFILLLLLELNSTLIFYSKLLWIYTVFRKKHPLLFPCITLRSINRLK